MWSTMKEELDKRFEGRWEEFKTQGPGDAIQLARSAALDPSFHLIVSVGGDGTHNEVLNGLLSSHEVLSSSSTFSTTFSPTSSTTFSTTSSSSSSSPVSSGPGSRTGSPGLSEGEEREEGEERVMGLRETGKMPALGFIPVGTGGDLRRTLFEEEMADFSALDYLSLLEGPSSSLLALDVGLVEYTPFSLSPVGPKGSSPSSPSSSSSGVPLVSLGSLSPSPVHRRYFLNISSCGISGAICDAANKSSKAFGGFFTFFVQTCYQSLVWKNKQVKWRLGPQSGEGGESSEGPDSSRHPWISGNLFQLVIANGKYFGGGMKVAPDAKVNDGLFDVIAFCDVGVMDASILVKTYTGTHTSNPNGQKVRVHPSNFVEADLVSPSPSPPLFFFFSFADGVNCCSFAL
eukprot:TRINITY_DN3896_c0_g1_i1.p1 TRINITY_DN3896_c0_g1~~TRINITY_DN3896_c0_g1_i1.p1  ORF type:complete len:430 (-),score=154.49 TRINITY_DN3896_c0_g1_i1:6-1211(-)